MILQRTTINVIWTMVDKVSMMILVIMMTIFTYQNVHSLSKRKGTRLLSIFLSQSQVTQGNLQTRKLPNLREAIDNTRIKMLWLR
jgi:hypothetical protein